MWCGRCNRELIECICPDVEERLNNLRSSPNLHIPTIVDANLKKILERKERDKSKVKEK